MPEKSRLIIALWVVSAFLMFAPYGVTFQFIGANNRAYTLRKESPYHKICYKCGRRPATSEKSYQLSTHYFCSRCTAPAKLSWNPLEYILSTENGHGHWVLFLLAVGIYLPNYYRVIVNLLSSGRKYKMSLNGAVWAIIGMLFLEGSMAMKYRFSWGDIF
jgi:hypothetical protein